MQGKCVEIWVLCIKFGFCARVLYQKQSDDNNEYKKSSKVLCHINFFFLRAFSYNVSMITNVVQQIIIQYL